jgi:uncharacterized membrane protein YhaH (DUF805 family)
MLDMIFGLNARLGRLAFFLSSIAVGVVTTLLCVPIALVVYRAGASPATPSSLWSLGWPILGVAAFYLLCSFMLISMRLRDIGWSPVIAIPCWVAILILDSGIASQAPALALPHHDHTIFGGLINLGFCLALMFWPGSDRVGPPSATFRDALPKTPSWPISNSSSVSAERIARVTGQFGRRS